MTRYQLAIQKGYKVTKKGEVIGISGKILKTFLNQEGYEIFTAILNGSNRKVRVHKVQAFQKFGSEVLEKGIVVRHKNNIKTDNSWDNILIGSHKDNVEDRVNSGRCARGVKNGRSKLTEQKVSEIYLDEEHTNKELADKFEVSVRTVSSIKKREKWVSYLDKKHPLK